MQLVTNGGTVVFNDFKLVDEDDGLPSPLRIFPSQVFIHNTGPADGVGRFGKHEVEVTAGRLCAFFQRRGNKWSSFTVAELISFYREQGWPTDDPLFGLNGVWFDDGGMGAYRVPAEVYLASDGTKFFVTNKFIERCADK